MGFVEWWRGSRVPLELRGTWELRSCFLKVMSDLPFELRGALRDSSRVTAGMNRASSPVEAGTPSSSPFLISISGFLWSLKRGVRVSFCVDAENLLASRVVRGVSGLLSMCIWNLWLFLEDATAFTCPFML